MTIKTEDKIMALARKTAGEFNGMIDDFVTKAKQPKFDVYLKAHEVPAASAKLIPAFFEKTIAELQEVLKGEDEQLVEGYSNFTKPQIRKLLKQYEAIVEACEQQAVSAKKIRKSRVVKEKSAAVVAKAVKYMKEYPELQLKSERPEKIVGASEVRVFNTKYNLMQVYRAEKDGKLTVKGTTIIGYSVADSFGKPIRHAEQVKDFVGMTKKTFEQAMSTIKSKARAVNGRINENCVIIKVA